MKYLLDKLDETHNNTTVKLNRSTLTLQLRFKPTDNDPYHFYLYTHGLDIARYEGSAVDLLAVLLDQTILLHNSYFNDDFSFCVDEDGDFLSSDLFGFGMDKPEETAAMFATGQEYYSEKEKNKLLETDPIRFLLCDWSSLTTLDVYVLRLIEDCLSFHETKQIPVKRSFVAEMIKDQDISFRLPQFYNAVPWVNTINEWGNRDQFFEEYINGSNETSYSCDFISDIVLAILYELSRDGVYLKQCGHCGKWFVPNTAKEQYCSRITDGKTCKQAAKAQKRHEPTDLQKKYNSVRTSLYNQLNKKNLSAEDINLIHEEVRKFSDEATIWKVKIKQGKATETEYSEWMDSQRIRSRKKDGTH